MLIDELINEVARVRRELYVKGRESSDMPNLAIYMSQDYWRDIMREDQRRLHGEVNRLVYEFWSKGTVFGCRIWVVSSMSYPEGAKHPPFVVVNVDG